MANDLAILTSNTGQGWGLDRRRFVGPEGSFACNDIFPSIHRASCPSTCSEGSPTARLDGRLNSELRPIHIKTGTVFQANGSSYVEAGKTKVVCAAYGPKPRPSSSSSTSPLLISIRFAPFALPGGRANPFDLANPETVLSQCLQQSLSPALLPSSDTSTVIEVHLTILEWDSPLSVGHCVLASSVALALARVPMVGLVVGITAALLPSSDQPVMDPSLGETSQARSILDLSYVPAMKTTTHLSLRSGPDWKSGSMKLDCLDVFLDNCRSHCELVHGLAVQALREAHLNSPAFKKDVEYPTLNP